jgi:hypothetical protein
MQGMINKKNVLGKEPDDIGVKDAIHTAIVSVRAGCPIQPGARCKLNENREAVPDDKGIGVADPFRKDVILRGAAFWLLMGQTEVPNVQHVWDNGIDFTAPTVEVKRDRYLVECAEKFGVTYEQVMEAAAFVVRRDFPAPYPGAKTEDELEEINDEIEKYELFMAWADETLHQFENTGTDCCPEYEYPRCRLFRIEAPKPVDAPPAEATPVEVSQ